MARDLVHELVRDGSESDEGDRVVEDRFSDDDVVECGVDLERVEEREGRHRVYGGDERGELARFGRVELHDGASLAEGVEATPCERRGDERAEQRKGENARNVALVQSE